jgi:ribonuclease G
VSKSLFVSHSSKGFVFAMTEGKKLVEYGEETNEKAFQVGDIYWGEVRKINPSLNACFVDVGDEKDGFLHYLDLGEHFGSLRKLTQELNGGKRKPGMLQNFEKAEILPKEGKIGDYLQKGDKIPVQITKEPINSKGPRLTASLSLAGRFCVLLPVDSGVSVSRKIVDANEKKRLKQIASQALPRNFGVIVRTAAVGAGSDEISSDIQDLVTKWKEISQKIAAAKPKDLISKEITRVTGLLRDLLSDQFDQILVDHPGMAEQLREYVQGIAPDKVNLVQDYKGKVPLFEHIGLDKQVKGSFGTSVSMPGGIYLVIEHTEALHVIDVNSGNRSKKDNDQQEHALQTNMDAAEEIARQLRLRDMGGIIVIDFIDLKSAEHRKALLDKMIGLMSTDRAKHHILPMSKFGLMEITRQRVRPAVQISTQEQCAACRGTGKIGPSLLITDQIESRLDFLLLKNGEKSVTISAHPHLAAYCKSGWPSLQWKWVWKYRKSVKVRADQQLLMGEYRFLNPKGEVIPL